ncbi:MAG: nitroreductase family protein [Sulfuricurvum sp.]|nr:nitroreductase family protein [Sulfuricurvum sp.]
MFIDSFEVRDQTLLTPERVTDKTTFLDWDSQPSSFKHYPHFCYRVPLRDHPSLQWLMETRSITSRQTVAHKAYYRFNVPSAGNLHPIEIYVQIRNITGLLSGLYHLEVLTQELVLITEIGAAGIEPYLGLNHRFSGCLVMFSIVPFRSSWKYGLRAWRYLYLDLGHQIGALSSSVRHFGHKLTKMFTQDTDALNRIMGMGEDERIVAVYGVGESSTRLAKQLEEPLMRVQPTDYTIRETLLSYNIKAVSLYCEIPLVTHWDDFVTLNRTRRSARGFNANSMSDTDILKLIRLKAPASLEIVSILLQAHTMHSGVYRHGECTVSGNFNSETVHLLLDQRFIAGANMVLLIYSENFSAHSHIEAGMYAQELYWVCEHLGVGCSGIGAFYDNVGSQWSDNPLLYAVAIGGKS